MRTGSGSPPSPYRDDAGTMRWDSCARAFLFARLQPAGLVAREDHRFAAEREVAPLRMALVVLGHQDPPQVRVPLEDDAEHVVNLALLVVGGRPFLAYRVDGGRVDGHAQLD